MSGKLNITGLKNSGLKDNQKPVIIAGPCSAESEEQVMQTAAGLHEAGVQIYRAGIWKPRTRPGSFEGVGSIGLPWLTKVKETYGMQIATEVANVKHVYECLKNGVDIIWIGARTTANPFAMQDIADAVKGVDIPILVKNPVNSDVDLWMGALERLNKAGITKLGAIHRGFSVYESKMYRNEPIWQIPIELKRRIPELPIICDPSHITGNSDMIASVSQKALDLDFDGLMIETHINPSVAWSDKAQQVTPTQFKEIKENLILRSSESNSNVFETQLQTLRSEIDHVDSELLSTLKKRMDVSSAIGLLKKQNNVTALQVSRWEEMIKERIEMGEAQGLSNDFINDLYRAVHRESITLQVNLMNKIEAEQKKA